MAQWVRALGLLGQDSGFESCSQLLKFEKLPFFFKTGGERVGRAREKSKYEKKKKKKKEEEEKKKKRQSRINTHTHTYIYIYTNKK